MKKKHIQLLKDVGIYILTIVMFAVLFYLGYLIYENYRDGSFTIENLSAKFAKEHPGEKYSHSSPIDAERGIAFFGYNCENTFVWKCHGQYYLFLSKINGHWQINESSKRIIW